MSNSLTITGNESALTISSVFHFEFTDASVLTATINIAIHLTVKQYDCSGVLVGTQSYNKTDSMSGSLLMGGSAPAPWYFNEGFGVSGLTDGYHYLVSGSATANWDNGTESGSTGATGSGDFNWCPDQGGSGGSGN